LRIGEIRVLKLIDMNCEDFLLLNISMPEMIPFYVADKTPLNSGWL